MSHTTQILTHLPSLWRLLRGFAAGAFALGALATSAPAGTLYVATCGDDTWTGTKSNCSAPDGPKLHIQAAIDAATDSDEIIVASGTYAEAINVNGKPINLRSASGSATTIINATSLHSPAVSCVNGEGADTIVDGFTITGDYGILSGDDRGTWNTGMGMYNDHASPTVRNCLFTNNYLLAGHEDPVFVRGGGIYNNGGAPSIENCTFSKNGGRGDYALGYAQVEGGGIFNDASDVTITGCTFTDNRADGEEGNADGGGICNRNSSVTIEDCKFSENGAQYGVGGGIFEFASNSSIDGCSFNHNGFLQGRGGGIYCDADSRTSVSNCNFVDNPASGGGGVCSTGGATVIGCIFEGNFTGDDGSQGGGGMIAAGKTTVENCDFRNNDAWNYPRSAHGGGMILRDEAAVRDCIFVENTCAGSGGGIYLAKGSPVVTNCVFSKNGSYETYPGIYNGEASDARILNCTFSNDGLENSEYASPATLSNCIIWDGGIAGPTVTVTYSDIQGGYDGVGNINADPRFVDADGDDFRLQPFSPCIDAADNSAVPSDITEDRDGKPRFVDLPCIPDRGNGTPPIVDMGAYEAGEYFVDCNENGVNDVCEILDGHDCNGNEILDECDISAGRSTDCDLNGVPDECEFDPFNGFAASFDGQNDSVKIKGTVYSGGAITIEGWVKPAAHNADSRLVEFGNAGDADIMALIASSGTSGNPSLVVYSGSDGHTRRELIADVVIPLDKWTHIAATSAADQGRVYVNGKMVAESFVRSPRETARALSFVARGASGQGGYFGGLIDEVRIWNVARTPAEIDAAYRLRLIGNEAGLVAYWRFDEGQGYATSDLAGDHDGTLFGGPTWRQTTRPACVSPADMNCDASVDFDDIDGFVTALTSRDEYESSHPNCTYSNADINADGLVDFDDIDGFVDCLINGGCD